MKKLIVVFSIFLSLVSCQDYPYIIPVEDDYFPLQVGNTWDYEPVPFTPEGPVFPGSGSISKKITKTTTLDGQKYYLMETTYTMSNQSTKDTAYYRVDNSKYVFVKKLNKPEENMYRLRAKDKENWKYKSYSLDGQMQYDGYKSITLGTAVLDSCKSYSFDAPAVADEESWSVLAPGIGLVSAGSNWVQHKLKKAVINGKQYNF